MVLEVGPTAPVYDRSAVTAGIMHFGVGNFHRSHQAMYLERLLRRGLASDWGIIGVGLLPRDAKMGEALRAQDFTYTLVELGGDGMRTATRIGSIIDYLHAPFDPGAVLERLASPAIRIVSLTITEGGYTTPDVAYESCATTPEGIAENPRSVFGLLAAGLKLRRDRGVAPFTVASCDNILGNGDVARRVLAGFARRAHGDEFADWIETEVALPNSMVDRITPVTGDAERDLVRDAFGIDDACPVVCEPFAQWVIEDDFALGHPRWDEVGAQLVDDVAPYELMKLRLLNGSHQAMAYTGLLRGHTYVHEAMADQVVVDLVERYMGEAAETLRPVDGIDVPAYRAELMARFGNPNVRDTLERLATRRERPRSDVPVAGRAGACPRRARLASRGDGDRGMGRAFVAGTAGERRVGRSSGKPGHRRPRECRHRPRRLPRRGRLVRRTRGGRGLRRRLRAGVPRVPASRTRAEPRDAGCRGRHLRRPSRWNPLARCGPGESGRRTTSAMTSNKD